MVKKIFTYIFLLLLVPAITVTGTIFFGKNMYMWIALCAAVLSCIPFFLSFEKSEAPAIKTVTIAVMVAVSVISRIIFAPTPGFKPVTAITVFTAMYFGKEAGFMTGALSALVSNMFFGQGMWTPFQMIIWGLIGFVGGKGAGAAYTAVRHLGQRGEKGAFIVFFFSMFSCLVTLPYLIFQYHPMEAWQLGYLLLAGLAASGGQFSITAAYCYAPSKEISVYDYSQVIFSALLGFILFQQIPDGYSILGYVLICATAIIMFLYNNRKVAHS